MKAPEAVAALGALAQDTRLALFRLLVQRGPDGLPAGVVAERLGVPPSALTFHLQQLLHAQLGTQRPGGRQIFYAAEDRPMNAPVTYLTEKFCPRGAAARAAALCDPPLAPR